MSAKGCTNIPNALCHWITFLSRAIPSRSIPTFIELLIGAMLTQSGFVTEAWLAIDAKRHWSSYYHWLQKGKWSWVKLGRQLAILLTTVFNQPHWFLVIDDTVVFRSSNRAPDCKYHHQHGNKPNRPTFVLGQGWVTLSAVVEKGRRCWSIPLLSRLSRTTGNSTKLRITQTLLRAVRGIFPQSTVLMDSWYMRRVLVLHLLAQGHQVIGQVRKDTALYEQPVRTGKRGRPRKYGGKYDVERIQRLPEHRYRLWLYGEERTVRYRSALTKARFLEGFLVRAVWVQLENEDTGEPSPPRLIIATDTTLNPLEVIRHYEKRWSIEPMFGQMKNSWGWKETWQQSRQTLHRWVQILTVGFALPQMLAIVGGTEIDALRQLTPWRVKRGMTAGRVRLGLRRILCHVRVRDWWDRKSRIFRPPDGAEYRGEEEISRKAA
jgi:DDE superfamily endonuclease